MIPVRMAMDNLCAACLGWIARCPDWLRVLTFHDVAEEARSNYSIRKPQFEAFISLLRDEGYHTIRVAELVAGLPSILEQRRVVALTFDDGYVSHLDTVCQLLGWQGMTATFFIISSLIERERKKATFGENNTSFLAKSTFAKCVGLVSKSVHTPIPTLYVLRSPAKTCKRN